MAKKEEQVLAPQAKAPAVIETAEGKKMNLEDLLNQMETAEVGMELTADYLKLEEGEEVRLLLVEMTSMAGMGDKKGEMVEAGKFIGKDGRYKICADKVLVSACRGLVESGKVPAMIAVTHVGWKKGPSGEYRDLLITDLKPKLGK